MSHHKKNWTQRNESQEERKERRVVIYGVSLNDCVKGWRARDLQTTWVSSKEARGPSSCVMFGGQVRAETRVRTDRTDSSTVIALPREHGTDFRDSLSTTSQIASQIASRSAVPWSHINSMISRHYLTNGLVYHSSRPTSPIDIFGHRKYHHTGR